MQDKLTLLMIFVLGIGGGFGLRIWASGENARITGPNQLQILADGSVIAAAGSHFYVHDSGGKLTKKIPASRLKSEFYIGSFWATDADTIILRNDQLMDTTLETGLRAFARRREPSLFDGSYSGHSILQRCELSTGICIVMGSGEGVFHTRRIFGLTADPSGQRVFVADTTSWELLELDASARMTRRAPLLFRFPNKLDWSEQGLWVADTNNHRLARVSTGAASFGEVLETIPVPRRPARKKSLFDRVLTMLGLATGPGDDFDWPIAFTRTPQGNVFVINSNTDFNATRVEMLDGAGKRIKTVMLPKSADSLDIEHDGERALIADFKGFAIHTIGLDGKYRGTFGSEEFKRDMEELAQARFLYNILGYVGFAMMIATLFILFLAQARERREK